MNIEDVKDEKKRLFLKKANICTNLAYILADVCHGYINEVESDLNEVGMDLIAGEKKRFQTACRIAGQLKEQLEKITAPIGKLTDSEDAYADSDFFCDLFALIVDRCGGKKDVPTKMRSTIFNQFPTQMGMYEFLQGKEWMSYYRTQPIPKNKKRRKR